MFCLVIASILHHSNVTSMLGKTQRICPVRTGTYTIYRRSQILELRYILVSDKQKLSHHAEDFQRGHTTYQTCLVSGSIGKHLQPFETKLHIAACIRELVLCKNTTRCNCISCTVVRFNPVWKVYWSYTNTPI